MVIMVKKDKKRAFTYTQKMYMLEVQKGKCAVCGKKLDPTTMQAGHKKDHAKGGKTAVENGFLAHMDCHFKLDKGILKNKKKVKKSTPKKIKNSDNFAGIGKNNPIKYKAPPIWL